MTLLSKNQLLIRIKKDASNSNHFTWLLDNLVYYQTQNNWIFAFKLIQGVTFFSVDPLCPSEEFTEDSFEIAWLEFVDHYHPKLAVFVSIGSQFLSFLKPKGFVGMQIGREPWINLQNCIPRGNGGKGVRSARNQAIKAGLIVEEWSAVEIKNNFSLQQDMKEIYQEWDNRRLIHLSGFILSTDSFAYMEERKYFILRSKLRIEAYLIASPVGGIQSIFLEDLILRKETPKGTGELLVLEALVALRDMGYKEASLGVVAINSLDLTVSTTLARPLKLLMSSIPKALKLFYNFDGMELFRKRFNPHRWTPVYLAVGNFTSPKISSTLLWWKIIKSFFYLFEFKFRIKPLTVLQQIKYGISNLKISIIYASITFLVFIKTIHFGSIEKNILEKYGFFPAAPFHEWPLRSISSDFLYSNQTHFLFTAIPLFLIIYFCERNQGRFFVLWILALNHSIGDTLDYLLTILPFKFVLPDLYLKLIAERDIGGSLIFFTFLGIQLWQINRFKDIIFTASMLISIFVIAAFSVKNPIFIINFNHILFFLIGYIIGKFRSDTKRSRSRKASKLPPPIAKSVFA